MTPFTTSAASLPHCMGYATNAPGSPELASHIVGLLRDCGFGTATANERGLDHGVWIPLRLMYPRPTFPWLRCPCRCS